VPPWCVLFRRSNVVVAAITAVSRLQHFECSHSTAYLLHFFASTQSLFLRLLMLLYYIYRYAYIKIDIDTQTNIYIYIDYRGTYSASVSASTKSFGTAPSPPAASPAISFPSTAIAAAGLIRDTAVDNLGFFHCVVLFAA